MASDPYITRNPYDIITSKDWNDIQSLARDDIRNHTHTGGSDGKKISRDGIADNAITGEKIDPETSLTVKALTVGSLNVLERINALTQDKLDKTGGTITGTLTIPNLQPVDGLITAKGLTVGGGTPLGDYTTVDPSHVYLHGPANSDAWIYRDSSLTTSNRGLYYHQGENPVGTLPGCSIGFVGGNNSETLAYVSLTDGTAFFSGRLHVGGTVVGVNCGPLMNQLIHRRPLFGHRQITEAPRYSQSMKLLIGDMYDFFRPGLEPPQAKATRTFRLYVIFANYGSSPREHYVSISRYQLSPLEYKLIETAEYIEGSEFQCEGFTDWSPIPEQMTELTKVSIYSTASQPSALCYAELQFLDSYSHV